ncbi:MAG: di-trans,poly-cis-decaprenylcistransferase [Cycloclasticus sp.]|nr:di-trans,poly-cis-decaprenylcistransferase [Cycloclasticus sp.]MBQ0789035.1 di-trans,poly-cis-decaprenylcistransferase [Cycloclasticus sp.]
MDGNGRWALRQNKARTYGHKAGVNALKQTIESCASYGVDVLTVFAFSSENWLRPKQEVDVLMGLFMLTLKNQAKKLLKNNIRLKIIGDRSRFSLTLQEKIEEVEKLTSNNSAMTLVIAANYGGQWDINQAIKRLAKHAKEARQSVDEFEINDFLSTAGLPEPDLFIRTGGEQRISNFLLWQIAYSELYFTDVLWPDFDQNELLTAIMSYSSRQRRFGHTGEQINEQAIK